MNDDFKEFWDRSARVVDTTEEAAKYAWDVQQQKIHHLLSILHFVSH